MTFLVRFAALAMFGAAALSTPAKAEDKIGFIYVGPAADYGYNTSMDLGRKYVEKHMPGVTTTAFEIIPETAEVERVMERLIASGHKIIFATSYGYLDYAIKVGEKYPDVTILHAGGLKTSKNVGTYWADSDAGMYLAGVAAAHVTKSGKLGFQGRVSNPAIDALGECLHARRPVRQSEYHDDRGLEWRLVGTAEGNRSRQTPSPISASTWSPSKSTARSPSRRPQKSAAST